MSGHRQPRPLAAVPRVQADWHLPRSRPYRWRDPARVDPARLAALDARERADYGGCDRCYKPWHLCRCPAG